MQRELLPRFVLSRDVAVEWLLYRQPQPGLARSLRTGALLIDFVTDSAPVGDPITSITNCTGLYVNDLFGADFALGSAYVFARSVLPGAFHLGRGVSGEEAPGRMISEMRYLEFEQDDAFHVVMTMPLSEDTLLISHTTELDGRCLGNVHGTLDRRSLATSVGEQVVDRRFCSLCHIRNEFCECDGDDTRRFFDQFRTPVRTGRSDDGDDGGGGGPQGRRRRPPAAVSSSSEEMFSLANLKRRLEGSWSSSKGRRVPVRVDVSCFESGTALDAVVRVVVQSQVANVMTPQQSCRWTRKRQLPPAAMRASSSSSPSASSLQRSSDNDGPFATGGPAAAPPPPPRRRPVPCRACGQMFRRKYDMKRHFRSIHDGKKDFQCPHCPKMYTQSGHLNEHIRTVHPPEVAPTPSLAGTAAAATGGTGREAEASAANEAARRTGMPTCAECGKVFGVRSKLERHIRTVHLNIRAHGCDICHRSYKERSTLREHYHTVHRRPFPDVRVHPVHDALLRTPTSPVSSPTVAAVDDGPPFRPAPSSPHLPPAEETTKSSLPAQQPRPPPSARSLLLDDHGAVADVVAMEATGTLQWPPPHEKLSPSGQKAGCESLDELNDALLSFGETCFRDGWRGGVHDVHDGAGGAGSAVVVEEMEPWSSLESIPSAEGEDFPLSLMKRKLSPPPTPTPSPPPTPTPFVVATESIWSLSDFARQI